MQEERDRIINILINLGYLKSDKVTEHITPGHGSCCTCQTCGYGYDECVCADNELLESIYE